MGDVPALFPCVDPCGVDFFCIMCRRQSALPALSRPELEALLVELFAELAAAEAGCRRAARGSRPPDWSEGSPHHQAERHGQAPSRRNLARRSKRRGRGKVMPRVSVEETVIEAEVPLRTALRGVRTVPGQTRDDLSARDTLPARALGHARMGGRSWRHCRKGS